MREIKFRAKDSHTGKWVYSSDTGLADFFYGIEDGQLDRNTLGQFADQLDKSASEIYEGDLLNSEAYSLSKYVVRFEGGCFLPFDNDWMLSEDTEVIGNIYENPELLNNR